jgi:hypothetical protein
MSSSLSSLFAAAEEHHRELPMPVEFYGALAFILFLAALGVLWTFRGTAHNLRQDAPNQSHDHH